MTWTTGEIAAALGTTCLGDATIEITAAAEPALAGPADLALAMNPKFADGLAEGQARAALLWDGADWQGMGLEAAIVAPRPRYAMSGITRLMDAGPRIAEGAHPSAVIDATAEIGAGAAIGPFVVVGPGVRIGRNARIASHVSIAEDATIGDDALILQGVRIGARVTIGDRFIAQPGCVVGADGFSFVTPETSRVEAARASLGAAVEAEGQSWTRIHSLGAVTIGDDVEIGANSTIDRGTIRDTAIGSGTKLDNLVHVGHNVRVGRDCLLCGQVGIAGSTVVGDRVVMGGQVGVSDNLQVGADAVLAGGSGVTSNVRPGAVLMGYPAMPMDRNIEAYKALRRLPRMARDVAELKKAVQTGDHSD
jgi:UDP-3-O-[3-hydroxymyristoyl] glucosamine N-acyltransferase